MPRQRRTNPRFVEMVMTQLDTLVNQHGNPIVVTRFKLRIGIDVDHFEPRAELGQQRRERGAHVVAEVAPCASVERERCHRASHVAYF